MRWECLWVGFLSGRLVFGCMHAFLSGCTLEVDASLCLSPHVSIHRLHDLCFFYNVFIFGNRPQCTVISNRFLFSVHWGRDTLRLQSSLPSSCVNSSWRSFGSALPESTGILTLLHAFEGNIDDGYQALRGAHGAEQPVWISPAQDPQGVALVEAQLPRLSGYVVAQCSYFTEERQEDMEEKVSGVELGN